MVAHGARNQGDVTKHQQHATDQAIKDFLDLLADLLFERWLREYQGGAHPSETAGDDEQDD